MALGESFGPTGMILALTLLLLVQASPAAAFGAGNIGELQLGFNFRIVDQVLTMDSIDFED